MPRGPAGPLTITSITIINTTIIFNYYTVIITIMITIITIILLLLLETGCRATEQYIRKTLTMEGKPSLTIHRNPLLIRSTFKGIPY